MTCECALELVMRFGAVLWSGALELVLVLCESYVLRFDYCRLLLRDCLSIDV